MPEDAAELAETVPSFTAVTEPFERFTNPMRYATRSNPKLWWRMGQGLIGIGEAFRLEFTGPDRIRQASEYWRRIVDQANVTDTVGLPGTGLVAFGAFTFSGDSAAPSIVSIPRVIIGKTAGQAWITRVAEKGEDLPAVPGPSEPLGSEVRIRFTPGKVTPDAYRESVAAALDVISQTDIKKIVLARDAIGHFPAEGDLRPIISSLALSYPDCWTFAINGVIGSSPETLVAVRDGLVTSRVLAGSTARGKDADQDHDLAITLASSRKELGEHELAVKTVVAALTDYATRITASPYPYALKLPNLWHLASDVSGQANPGVSSLDIVAAMHPTGAVAGYPRREAAAALATIEGFDRTYYSGPIGWMSSQGDAEWAVALRCARVLPGGDVTAYAGAGIVAGSLPDQELAETKLKMRPITEAFS